MSMGWAPVAFEAVGGDWHLLLALTGALVLGWGLVVVATAALFGGPAGGRQGRRFAALKRAGVRSGKPKHDRSPRAGVGHG
ncbi:hypothetical protein MycrhN_2768 [Mycolicibacterium rhodesiae NBB3]|uniref:Uncharacterized protein n=1 Tax=Mycolicibacterium rhodesiae (strain NBB3) TaxID=710685 RepID=G8RH42_MYCRN|nr:hypothetical protein [Mycolicibacterium rhodesiae]AEV73346.1 hypothetical protein MycrhN_2768 [Mycolicibacterium rhodesiae NBB3]